MSWIDDDDYLGEDRRKRRSLRLLERRRVNAAAPAPSLALLLRKLQIWSAELTTFSDEPIERYRARVQSVAKLARERGETCVDGWLCMLDERLASARHDAIDATDLSQKLLQNAIAALK